jgi:hypothetical protein
MKRYCFDMSGISTPLELMPADIHKSMWTKVEEILCSGHIAVTKEIYDEMTHIAGPVGDCIRANEGNLLLEVGQADWDWGAYLKIATTMQTTYAAVISEFNGGRKNTIGLTDVSIVALGKALSLPVVSMEAKLGQVSTTKKRIPEVCSLEGVQHYDFSTFLRKENISV